MDGAGEWYELKKILPDFKEKHVLDLGCGYGWHCKYAAEHKAKSVVGVDISEKMLKVAQEKNQDDKITYIHSAIEDFDTDPESYDAIISSLAFHYIKDYDRLINNIYKWLKPNGEFVFSVEHPILHPMAIKTGIMTKREKSFIFLLITIIMKGNDKQYFR